MPKLILGKGMDANNVKDTIEKSSANWDEVLVIARDKANKLRDYLTKIDQLLQRHREAESDQNTLNNIDAIRSQIENNWLSWNEASTNINGNRSKTKLDILAWVMSNNLDVDKLWIDLGGADIKVPLPKILTLRTNKLIRYVKTVKPGRKVSKDYYTEYTSLLQGMKKVNKHEANSASAKRLRELRKYLRIEVKPVYRYEFERGPYKYVASTSGFDYKELQAGYYGFRRDLSHRRENYRRLLTTRGRFGMRVGGVYMRADSVYREYVKRKAKAIFEDKKPKDSRNYVGLELEFASKSDPIDIAVALQRAGLESKVCLKSDGSLRISKSGDYTHELCILDHESTYRETVKNVCRVLKDGGAYVNPTCGFHVHLDMRNRDVNLSYARLVHSLNVLYSMIPVSRRFNKYCRRNLPNSTYQTADRDRYHAVNVAAMERHKTLEIRLHGGTLNARKITGWVDLLLHVLKATGLTKGYKTVERFAKAAKLPDDLLNYVKERVELFNQEEVDDDTEHVLRIFDGRNDSGPRCNCAECSQARSVSRINHRDDGSWDEDDLYYSEGSGDEAYDDSYDESA